MEIIRKAIPVNGTPEKGKCLVVIGDIHGRFDLLQAIIPVIKQALPSKAQSVDLVFLGDIIDRGEHAIDALDFIDQGFDDAWLMDENGYITEGTSNNAWIVTKDGVLKTRKPDHDILNGITRQSIMALAVKKGLQIVEEAFTLDDVYNAKEAFISSASACIKPVTQINERQIGNGSVGIITQQIAEIYAEFLENHP